MTELIKDRRAVPVCFLCLLTIGIMTTQKATIAE